MERRWEFFPATIAYTVSIMILFYVRPDEKKGQSIFYWITGVLFVYSLRNEKMGHQDWQDVRLAILPFITVSAMLLAAGRCVHGTLSKEAGEGS